MTAPSYSPLPGLWQQAPRFLFFTGKGGVGKTSMACATAVALADQGLRVLLVSTDPASNLDEVLETPLSSQATPIASVPGLSALNLNPEQAACAYREKIIAPQRGLLPDAVLRSMEEQLSGACTTEIATFDEFTRLLGQPDATSGFDHVIFDTAPTGHTLRLLLLPQAWTGFLKTNTSGTSCLGPLAGLEQQRGVYEAALAALRDAHRTRMVLVARPQTASLREAMRTARELTALGIPPPSLVLNGLFHARDPGDAVSVALEARATAALSTHRDWLSTLPTFAVPLQPHNLLGVSALRALAGTPGEPVSQSPTPDPEAPRPISNTLLDLADLLDIAGPGVVMTMGKGGVGKTTVAAALAVELARRGRKVMLSTTDPAAHLVQTLDGSVPGLVVGRIDPAAETAQYTAEVLAAQGGNLDAEGRALLEEDLRSPCTEEIAVFRAFARVVAQGRDHVVILDTAPTGHTLLLLDATQAYNRELGRQTMADIPPEVAALLPRLRDAAYTRVLLVALPEATPVHEAAALQADLRRAGIEPFAWVINQSLAEVHTTDPLLRERARREGRYLDEVARTLARQHFIAPWSPVEPVGQAALRDWLHAPALVGPG